MKKSELIKAIEHLPDDAEVVLFNTGSERLEPFNLYYRDLTLVVAPIAKWITSKFTSQQQYKALTDEPVKPQLTRIGHAVRIVGDETEEVYEYR